MVATRAMLGGVGGICWSLFCIRQGWGMVAALIGAAVWGIMVGIIVTEWEK